MTETVTTPSVPVPAQRTAQPAPAPRKERPASEFWDVDECCWRAAAERAAVSPGVPAAG